MTRNITQSFRISSESSFADEIDLIFLTISHPSITDIYLVNDTVDYLIDANTYIGFPFEIEILSDDETPPTARLTIQNVDPRIGDSIRSLTTPPRLKIELLSSVDFDLTVDPRVEVTGDDLGVLMLHFDGTDASTTFTDDSGSGHVVTPIGNAQIDTSQSKFGGASALFDGAGDYLDLDGSTDFAFGTGDFTIDLWFRLNGIGTFQNIYDARPAATEGAYVDLFINTSNVLIYKANSATQITGTTVLTTGVWRHLALVRSGTSTKLFLDGVQEGSTYSDSTNYLNPASKPRIGNDSGITAHFNGWMDELHILKGTAMWTAAFTPPTDAYAASGASLIYSADSLFLTNVSVDIMTISGQIVGWDYQQRVWPAERATQDNFPGLFRS